MSEYCNTVKIKFAIRPDHNPTLRAAIAAAPDAVVTTDKRDSVTVDTDRRQLAIFSRPQAGLDAAEAAQVLAGQTPANAVGIVVASSIPHRLRNALESAGLSWVDGRGAIHLTWPGTLVHIERAGHSRHGVPDTTDSLGPTSIRAVQVMLSDPEQGWTVSRLARRASVSTGQAHKVFQILERNQLIDVSGSGPQTRRRIADRDTTLDWLLALERRKRKPNAVRTYVYGRSTRDVLQRFDALARDAAAGYAVTAAAAAEILGMPVLTAVDVSHIRVTGASTTDILHLLGLDNLSAEEGGRGSNLELWSDVGELGTWDTTEVNGIHVAPPVRVWLDLARLGGREADAAQTYREQLIERT